VLLRWGASPLASLDHSPVQEWVTGLGDRLSPASVSEWFRLASGVLRSAVRDRPIGFNPCEGVKLRRRRRMDTDDKTISRQQLAVLLPATPYRYRALIALAAGTGLRWGEVVGLRWDAIDLAAGVVVRVAEEVSGHVRLKPYPKSRAGRRTVPLPPFVVELLRHHEREYPAGEKGLVFVARTGEPHVPRSGVEAVADSGRPAVHASVP
jgi:integrase